jgi:hypothetical protein
MSDKGFRVTVEDLESGEKQSVEVASGDYVLLPFGSCHLTSVSRHGNGTVQLTLKDHAPQFKPRRGADLT